MSKARGLTCFGAWLDSAGCFRYQWWMVRCLTLSTPLLGASEAAKRHLVASSSYWQVGPKPAAHTRNVCSGLSKPHHCCDNSPQVTVMPSLVLFQHIKAYIAYIGAGDFHQLPPVAKGREAAAARKFAFEAASWRQCVRHCAQLTKVFRQVHCSACDSPIP